MTCSIATLTAQLPISVVYSAFKWSWKNKLSPTQRKRQSTLAVCLCCTDATTGGNELNYLTTLAAWDYPHQKTIDSVLTRLWKEGGGRNLLVTLNWQTARANDSSILRPRDYRRSNGTYFATLTCSTTHIDSVSIFHSCNNWRTIFKGL